MDTVQEPRECPACGRPLEKLLMPITMDLTNEWACFSGWCKWPYNRYKEAQ